MSAAETPTVATTPAAPAAAAPGVAPGSCAPSCGSSFRRRRNQAGLLALAAVPIVLAISIRLSSRGGGGGGPAFLDSITGNGLFVALAALTVALPLFLPLAVSVRRRRRGRGRGQPRHAALPAGGPGGRTRLLAVKYAGCASARCWRVVVVVAVAGAIIGVALFGAGPLTPLSGTQLDFGGGLGRLLLVVALPRAPVSPRLGAWACSSRRSPSSRSRPPSP